MRTLARYLIISILSVFLLEGVVSIFLLADYIVEVLGSGENFDDERRGIPGTKHARYDSDLGWINIPNVRVNNIYDPGTYIQINGQGFRNEETFNLKSPEGKFRIVCSGDSYTFGHGVSNPDAWCNYLAQKNQDIQTINMGANAYGADQAYLWYKRDGIAFDHDVHLFVIIRPDLERMLHSNYFGHEKPVLRLDQEKIIVENVPVPNNLDYRKLLRIKDEIFGNLALGRFTKKMVQDYLPRFSSYSQTEDLDDHTPYVGELNNAFLLISAIISDLADINAQKMSRLVFVLLPIWADWEGSQDHEVVRERLRQICKIKGIDFIDLTDAFRQHDYLSAASFFRSGMKGRHYSVEGNHFVARQILNHLMDLGIYVPKGGAQTHQ